MRRHANTPALGLTLTATVVLSLVACGRDSGPVLAAPVAPTAAISAAAPAGVRPDTSVPDATTAFAVQAAAERAKTLQDSVAAMNQTDPPNTMSKEQESKAMPLPGQANDHSTPTRDDKRKVPPAN